MKVQDKKMVNKVYEGIADICLILIVNRQIEKVVLSLVILVDLTKELLLIVLVRDVPYHDSGTDIFAPLDLIPVKLELRLITCDA